MNNRILSGIFFGVSLFLLSACGGGGGAASGQATLTVSVAGIDRQAARADAAPLVVAQMIDFVFASAHAASVIPTSVTKLVIAIMNSENQTLASGDVIALGGSLIATVPTGEALNVVAQAFNSNGQLIYIGNNHVDPLVAGQSAQIAITMALNNLAPVASNGSLSNAPAGTLLAVDANGDTLTFSIVTQATLGTVSITDIHTGAYVYTPFPGASGTDSFTFKVNDGTTDSNVATVTVEVVPAIVAPVASDGTLSSGPDGADGRLQAIGAVGSTLTYSIVSPPASGVVTLTDVHTGAYTYVPSNAATGSDSFTFKVSDGTLESNSATITVTLLGVAYPLRASVGPNGIEADAASSNPSLSDDGRFVAYQSLATNLVADDTNAKADVFVYDTLTRTTARVSVSSADEQANDDSMTPTHAAISGDGSAIVFASAASNLVVGDSNSAVDVFIRDTLMATTIRVSVDSNGGQSNGKSSKPNISADGRFVTFSSAASNLVAGDTNSKRDIFVYDRLTQTTTRVSVDSNGAQTNNASDTPVISRDGRYIAFQSNATNLVPGATTGRSRIYVRDTLAGLTTLASVANPFSTSDLVYFNPAISGNGRYVVFDATDFAAEVAELNEINELFVQDLNSGSAASTSLGSIGEETSEEDLPLALSYDGRFVVFPASAASLVNGDTNGVTDVYVRDIFNGAIARASFDANGIQGDSVSDEPTISANGAIVAFTSSATNLVASDTNQVGDIFIARNPLAP